MKMKMFEHPKREFFTSKARLNFEVYGQRDKIPPEAGGKRPLFCAVNAKVILIMIYFYEFYKKSTFFEDNNSQKFN